MEAKRPKVRSQEIAEFSNEQFHKSNGFLLRVPQDGIVIHPNHSGCSITVNTNPKKSKDERLDFVRHHISKCIQFICDDLQFRPLIVNRDIALAILPSCKLKTFTISSMHYLVFDFVQNQKGE